MSDFKKFCIDEKLSPVQIVGARKAWQHQQSKIDELQKQVDALKGQHKLFGKNLARSISKGKCGSQSL